MKQPEAWTDFARRIVSTGERPLFAPEPEVLDAHSRVLADMRARRDGEMRALVLGATPELADLALQHGFSVLRVDCNPLMFEAAQRRQTVADRTREQSIVADWLDLSMIPDASIDMVLGDSSLNNVPHPLMGKLLDELGRVTAAGATLSLRQIVMPDAHVDDYAFDVVVARYRRAEMSANEFHKVLRFYSCAAETYDATARVLDAKKVFAAIDRRHLDGGLSAEEHAFLRSRYSEIAHTVYRREEQMALLSRLGPCRAVRAGAPCYFENLICVFVVERP
jgi:hypothetical protein